MLYEGNRSLITSFKSSTKVPFGLLSRIKIRWGDVWETK